MATVELKRIVDYGSRAAAILQRLGYKAEVGAGRQSGMQEGLGQRLGGLERSLGLVLSKLDSIPDKAYVRTLADQYSGISPHDHSVQSRATGKREEINIRFLTHADLAKAGDFLQEKRIPFLPLGMGAVSIEASVADVLKNAGFSFEAVDNLEALFSNEALIERFNAEVDEYYQSRKSK